MNLTNYRLVLSLAALPMIATIFAGCNLFDKADNITFPSQIEVLWVVDEEAVATDAPYAYVKTVSLADDPEVEKYMNKLKNVEVEKITYRVEEYVAEGDAVMFKNGKAIFATAGSAAVEASFTASASGVNLQTSTSDTDLIIDTDELNELASVLKTEKEIDMNLTGILSKTPVSFKIVATFQLKVTAEVLD
ncbi:MAG TPA: hypothetical protein VGD65_26585 [Chryseosolibacter sp.]